MPLGMAMTWFNFILQPLRSCFPNVSTSFFFFIKSQKHINYILNCPVHTLLLKQLSLDVLLCQWKEIMCPPERRQQNRERIAKLFVFRLHFPADKLWNMYSNDWLFGGIFLIRKWKISLIGFRIQLGRSLCIKAFDKLQLLRWRTNKVKVFVHTNLYVQRRWCDHVNICEVPHCFPIIYTETQGVSAP